VYAIKVYNEDFPRGVNRLGNQIYQPDWIDLESIGYMGNDTIIYNLEGEIFMKEKT
jgi:hypothetical protein